jgi:Na+/H+ antiporter NhaD/arsenite permease-like protein
METASQVLIIIIFILMFVVITIGKVHRYVPALVGAGLTLLVLLLVLRNPGDANTVLNFGEMGRSIFWYPGHEHLESHGINWQTVIFIAGMMTMVEGMGAAGFFRWLCLLVAKTVRYKVTPIMIAFILLSGFLSMFIDSITVLLFMTSVTIELARMLEFDPVPIIISMIFAANVGGSATMAGDPPNIIIGTAFGYTFIDFLKDTGPIAWITMVFTVGYFYFVFRKNLAGPPGELKVEDVVYPEPREAITDPRLFRISSGIFIFVVMLLVTHAQTGISVASVGVIAAVLTLSAAGKGAMQIIHRIDWRTLLFFIGLFVVVGGLEVTETLKLFARLIEDVSGSNMLVVITIIIWASAFLSSIVDNIPFAATMVPVIANLSGGNPATLKTLSWTLALGTDIGGNGTPIGASANVVGTAIAEREGHPIGWGRFCKYAMPAMIIAVAICWLFIYLWHY